LQGCKIDLLVLSNAIAWLEVIVGVGPKVNPKRRYIIEVCEWP
jgi:hypothetical protein